MDQRNKAFIGNYLVKVDRRNRINLPANIANRINGFENKIYVFIKKECIQCFPQSRYELLKKEINYEESPLEILIRKGKRITLEELSELKKDNYVKIVGCMNFFEIWNVDSYEHYLKECRDDVKKIKEKLNF